MTEPINPVALAQGAFSGTAKLAAALVAVQAELPTIPRSKTVTVTQRNGEQYSYSYAPLDEVTKTIMPLLAKNGLAFTAFPGTSLDGKGMCVRYTLMHTSGETMTGEFPISGEGGIQQLGGKITYVRRYALAAVVGLALDEDDESRMDEADRPTSAARRPTKRANPARPRADRVADDPNPPEVPLPGDPTAQRGPEESTGPQRQRLAILFGEYGIDVREQRLAAIATVIGRQVGSMTELTKEEATRVMEFVEDKIEQRRAADNRAASDEQ